MNDVQQKLSELQGKGWTLAAIADGIGLTLSAVEKWKSGIHYPAASKPTLMALDVLLERKPPKKRRYPTGHYMQRRKAEREGQGGSG